MFGPRASSIEHPFAYLLSTAVLVFSPVSKCHGRREDPRRDPQRAGPDLVARRRRAMFIGRWKARPFKSIVYSENLEFRCPNWCGSNNKVWLQCHRLGAGGHGGALATTKFLFAVKQVLASRMPIPWLPFFRQKDGVL